MTYLAETKNTYILTFGYGNRSNYDIFLEYLDSFNVFCVVDVRLTPRAWSRKWYGGEIEKVCASKGIKYISKVSLGNISGNNSWIPPDDEEANRALIEISNIALEGTILLLCAEMDFSKCHRVDVAHKLEKLVFAPVKHLK